MLPHLESLVTSIRWQLQVGRSASNWFYRVLNNNERRPIKKSQLDTTEEKDGVSVGEGGREHEREEDCDEGPAGPAKGDGENRKERQKPSSFILFFLLLDFPQHQAIKIFYKSVVASILIQSCGKKKLSKPLKMAPPHWKFHLHKRFTSHEQI